MTIDKKYHPFLISLATSDNKTRKQLLKTCDKKSIKLIAQIAANVISGNIKLSPQQLKRLKHYKTTLRELRHRRTSLANKRTLLLKQRGGFLPFLVPIIASAVGGLVSRVFTKK